MSDQPRTCKECAGTFLFREHEQQLFAAKDYNPPGRCPDCRRRRKEYIAAQRQRDARRSA
jgi:hypothetical protein